MFDRQRGGVDLSPVVGRYLRNQMLSELLESAPQPARSTVELALSGQRWEQIRPVAANLFEKPRLGAASEQVTDDRDREDFGVAA